jgi:hypothetical protein
VQSDAAVAVSVDEYVPAGQAWLSKRKKEEEHIQFLNLNLNTPKAANESKNH